MLKMWHSEAAEGSPPPGPELVWEQGALRVAFDLNSCLGRFEPHEMDRSYAMPPIVIGCDLARAWLDIHALPGGEPSRIGNTRAVIAGWIPGIDPAALVVFEATSGGDGPLIDPGRIQAADPLRNWSQVAQVPFRSDRSEATRHRRTQREVLARLWHAGHRLHDAVDIVCNANAVC
jgi:hypothetical protein